MPQAWPPSAPGGPTTPYDAYVETIGDEIMNDALVIPRNLYYVERRLVAEQAAEIVRLSAALVAGKELADGWRPIKSAPKDGDEVWLANKRYVAVGYNDDNDLGWRANGTSLSWTPTHWQPYVVPAPPED